MRATQDLRSMLSRTAGKAGLTGKVWVTALAVAMLSTTAAQPQSTPRFFGFASTLQFDCDLPELTQKAGVTMNAGGAGALYAGWGSPPNPRRAYALDAELLAPLVPRKPHLVTGGKWTVSINGAPIFIVVDPDRTTLDGHATFRPGKWMVLSGTGTMEHYDTRSHANPVQVCPVSWFFAGQRRNTPPRNPRGTRWIRRTFGSLEFEFQAAQLSASSPLREAGVTGAATAPLWVAVTPCATQTACFGAPGSNRADLLVRVLPASEGRQGPAYLPLTPAGLDVWSRTAGEAAAAARAWLIPAATTALDRPGFLDLVGYTAPAPAAAIGEPWEESARHLVEFDPERTTTVREAGPPPPAGPWLTAPTLPGFRFKAALAGTRLVKANACPTQTLCFARAAPGAPEIVARILPTQANGKRWPVLGKFATQAAEVWIEQIASRQIRHYELLARAADSPELAGAVDRVGFAP